MAEITIDQSKLPGVKEVCRDFAVLEDHTLAHSLQEQEIEHHLATNVQRNRLVQGDLQIAKQLQEEEDRRARACIQERHKDIERQDCEIAQEIQVKLVIEAEQLRRQEEDDEDIARVLQQKELQGERKKRKPPAEPLRHGGYKESYYLDSRDRPSRSPPGQPSRSWSGDRQPPQPRDTRRGPPFVTGGLELEVLGSSSEGRKAKDSQRRHQERQRDKNPGGREKPWKEEAGEALEGGSSRSRDVRAASEEGPRRTSPLGQEAGHGSREGQRRRPRSRERPQSLVDWRDEEASRRHKHRERLSPRSEKSLRPPSLGDEDEEERCSRRPESGSPSLGGRRPSAQEERQPPRPSSHDRRPRDPDTASQRSHRRPVERGEERGRVGEPSSSSSSSSSSRHGESQELDPRCSRQPGTKSRGTKEATFPKSPGVVVQDLESFDAEIARKLQEEELLAREADKKAAQVAQDEEIARLLMAEEKKAFKKAKEREKPSSEEKKRQQDQDWKHNTSELRPPRSREDHDPHRGRSDKPTRPPPPPTEELDHLVNLTIQQSSAYQVPKPEPSHKGYHYKP